MKRICDVCKKPLLVKDTGLERTNWVTNVTTYVCRSCREDQVAAMVRMTREQLGIPRS